MRCLIAALLVACGSAAVPEDAGMNDAPPMIDSGPPLPPFDTDINGFHVHLDRNTATLTITRADGTVIFGGIAGGAASGDPRMPPAIGFATRHGTATYMASFGQFRIRDTSTDPWIGATRYGEPSTDPTLDIPLLAGDGSSLGT